MQVYACTEGKSENNKKNISLSINRGGTKYGPDISRTPILFSLIVIC
nr:MAG TPA: hypothetical protein [Myoviridae sp. ctfuG5]DAN24640.1 MAG TPA: hypothetical protein [Caudoviricetes sp.]